MILIQSSSSDASTNDVLDWLYYLGADSGMITRVNDTHNIQAVTINISNAAQSVCLKTKDGAIDTAAVSTRWYRRGKLQLEQSAFTKDSPETLMLSLKTRGYLDQEFECVYDFIEHSLLHEGKDLNKPRDDRTNKLDNLKRAAALGLSIPETMVTNVWEDLLAFSGKHKQVITKSLDRNSFVCQLDGAMSVRLGMGTILLDTKMLNAREADRDKVLPLPALYQQYINKKIELRIFYLDGNFYPMAIFSQANERTRVDFRNYDPQRPNRCVPYRLPGAIEAKLDFFMRSSGLAGGSIDMILTLAGEYVFLEVNPVGQFQWLDMHCNYNINKEIATYLLNGHERTP